MQPIKIYSSIQEKNPLQIKFEDTILKYFKKKGSVAKFSDKSILV